MHYEITELSPRTITGITARNNNFSPSSAEVIGGLWQQLYNGVYLGIPDKVNSRTIALYNHYESDEKGDYDITVGCETAPSVPLPQGLSVQTIPGGRYAHFRVQGDVQSAVTDFWQALWQLPLDRRFEADFEEYTGTDPQNMTIDIYISLR